MSRPRRPQATAHGERQAEVGNGGEPQGPEHGSGNAMDPRPITGARLYLQLPSPNTYIRIYLEKDMKYKLLRHEPATASRIYTDISSTSVDVDLVYSSSYHVAEHVEKPAIGVVGEAAAAALGEAGDDLVVEAEVEHGVHHAGHGDGGPGAHGQQQRPARVAQA